MCSCCRLQLKAFYSVSLNIQQSGIIVLMSARLPDDSYMDKTRNGRNEMFSRAVGSVFSIIFRLFLSAFLTQIFYCYVHNHKRFNTFFKKL